jgi:hypothetical protein
MWRCDPVILRLEFHGDDFMRRTLVGFAILIIICAGVRSAAAGEKIDVRKVITKADAEKILGVPVKDAKGRNQNGADGYYDSEWSYHAIKGDKALIFDVLYAGREAPPHLTQTMFSVLPADGGKSTRIDGLGDKAIFCPNETGMAMLHVLKGDILITIGVHGLPADAVLDPEKSMARKILANL